MKFPEYSAYPDRRQQLVGAYIGAVARREALSRDELEALPAGSLRRLGLEIGRGCMAIAYRSGRAGDAMLTAVQQKADRFVDVPRTAYERAQRAHHRLAGLILARRNPEQVAVMQRLMHLEAMDELKQSWNFYQSNWIELSAGHVGDIKGGIVEHTATGLFTRLAHPWMVATPSLLHQNAHQSSNEAIRNIDTILVETGPYTIGPPSIHRIQTKAGCLYPCDDPLKSRIKRKEYAPEVTMVSGHCDLGVVTENSRLFTSPYTDLLIAEADGTATPGDIQALDEATNRLLFTIDDPRRRGTYTPDKIQAPQLVTVN